MIRLVLLLWVLWQVPGWTWNRVALSELIAAIEARTEYRFLYRDALVAGVRISLETDAERWQADLTKKLAEAGIGMRVDEVGKQVVLYAGAPLATERQPTQYRGVVLDAATGARLPYATVMWPERGLWRGVVTDPDGRFAVPAAEVVVRFAGYRPATVRLSTGDGAAGTAVRLVPEPYTGEPVIVQRAAWNGSDSTGARLLIRSGITGFSEPGALRALRASSAVASGGAASAGLAVRGSKPDGMQVLLDGIPIYTHHHLFGLFDPFNPDALHVMGFHAGIAPATVAGPPGGTLSYHTRTGNQRQAAGSMGISSSAVRGVLEGPLAGGAGSYLIGGRHSYLNQVDWFGNQMLLRWGLNVDRPRSELDPSLTDFTAETVIPDRADATFHDAHAKLLWETPNGASWVVSGYSGADRTDLEADRLLRADRVATRNRWAGQALNLQHAVPVASGYWKTQLAWSGYASRFSKDDYLYFRYIPAQDRYVATTQPFSQTNRLHDWRLGTRYEWFGSGRFLLTLGATVARFDIRYEEQSLSRPDYFVDHDAWLTDLYVQSDWEGTTWVDADFGLRVHHFSPTGAWYPSPRLRMDLLPGFPIQAHAGYSRNHQFLHGVSLKSQTSAEAWIGSERGQAPSHTDHWTLGLSWLPGDRFRIRTDVYDKRAERVRLHEVNPATARREPNTLDAPWFDSNELDSRGWETQLSGGGSRWEALLSHTWSRAEYRNPMLNQGRYFAADWDRRHRIVGVGSVRPGQGWELSVAGDWASGAPNTVRGTDAAEPDRLAPTFRVDTGLRYTARMDDKTFSVAWSVYNLFDRDNTWYRSPVLTTDTSVRPLRFDFHNVDVYDLGRMTSLDVSIRF